MLSVVSHIILDAHAKSTVEGMMEGIVAATNLGCILVELNHILHDLVSVAHLTMFQGILGISDGIERAKIGLEFVKECSIRVLPCQQVLQIGTEDVWSKPVKSSAGKEKDGVVDFTGICCKGSGSIIKVQLKGDNESIKLSQIRAIKGIRFFDLGMDVVGSRIV